MNIDWLSFGLGALAMVVLYLIVRFLPSAIEDIFSSW